MTPKKIWVTIIGSGLIASITTAATFFPDLKVILISAATFVTAAIAFVNGTDNKVS